MIRRIALPLWDYRSFILGSIQRDFQAKYRRSLLGVAWAVIQPLATIVIYILVFSQVMAARLPGTDSTFAYSIYLCAGVLCWGLFAEITVRAQNMFLENANLLKKLRFPWLSLPLIVVGSACLNFAIAFGLFTLFLLAIGNFPGWVYFSLLPVLAIEVVLAMGLGLVLGVMNVFFRDVGQFFAVSLQLWFWLTPIVYPANILPSALQTLISLNPMAHLIGASQAILVRGEPPHWLALALVGAFALLLCGIGVRLFSARWGDMVDEL